MKNSKTNSTATAAPTTATKPTIDSVASETAKAPATKPKGIYKITCVVTGETAGTTPAVFNKRAARYGVAPTVLKENYVGRTATRVIRELVAKGETAAEAVAKVRAAFDISGKEIDKSVLDKVVEPVIAKAKAVKADAAFEAKKAKALAALLGTKK